jgi:hypothetical protein
MPFEARSAATIRQELLDDWRARHAAATPSRDLDIQEGSDAYNEADALALLLEGIELGAQESANRVLVRSSFGADLVAFAEDLGTAPYAASPALRTVRVTGANSTTYALSGQTLGSAGGLSFTPVDSDGDALTSLTTNSSGYVDILTECTEAGTAGNLPVGTVLTWSSAPSGMGSTGTINGATRAGEEAEDDAALQTRLLELLRERPASGNRADWRAKAMEITGVEGAFVYRLLAPVVSPATRPGVGTPHTPGCVTVVVVGPAQGTSATNDRIIDDVAGAELTAHKGYFEGTHDADGFTITAARGVDTQWIPAILDPDDYTVEAANVQAQNVTAALLLDSSASWAWSGAAMTITISTLTTIVVSGNQTAKNNADALVFVGTSFARGGWVKVNLGTGVVGGGGDTTFTFTALASAPDTSRGAYPAPSVWTALQTAAFAHFDALAPGDVDTVTYPRSARFPPESWGAGYYSKLYRLLLGRDLMGVSGVLTANVTTPSGDVTPAAKTIVTLGEFLAVPA